MNRYFWLNKSTLTVLCVLVLKTFEVLFVCLFVKYIRMPDMHIGKIVTLFWGLDFFYSLA